MNPARGVDLAGIWEEVMTVDCRLVCPVTKFKLSYDKP